MKKITLLFMSFFLGTIMASSQIISLIDEDFTANSLPDGWELYEGGTGTQMWSFGNNVMPGNSSFHVDDFPNNAAIFDDDAAGNNGQHDYASLISPYFDVNDFISTYKLRYQYALNNKGTEGENYFEDVLSCYLSDMDGNDMILETHDYTMNPTYQWVMNIQQIVYEEQLNPSNLRIIWVFDDVDNSWGWGAGIDDVVLFINPENDACEDAYVVNSLPYSNTINAIGATNNNGFINPPGCDGMNDGVWFTFTPTSTGTVTIDVYSIDFDAAVGVYSGTCGDFTCVAFADDPEYIEDLNVTAGTQYFINVGYWSGNLDFPEGEFSIDITGTIMGDINNYSINDFDMYPNPVKNTLVIKAKEKLDEISIYNIMGQEIMTSVLGLSQTTIDVSLLSKGVYTVKVKAGIKTGSYQLIKE